MLLHPRYLTKYFKKEDKHWYKVGSLKFGNVAEYRKAEEKGFLKARGDRFEGIEELGDPSWLDETRPMQPESGSLEDFASYYKKLRRRSEFYKDVPSNVFVHRNVRSDKINAYVFCATEGPYSRLHHQKMLEGDLDTGYEGDTCLTNYCVFDTNKLIEAVKPKLIEQATDIIPYYGVEILHWAHVRYDWRKRDLSSALDAFTGSRMLETEEVLRMLTSKRKLYSTENEFRLIARMRQIVYDDDPAISVKSERIRESIILFGDITQPDLQIT